MKEILRRLGIEELNYMQQDSLAANRKKDNVILISPTGSGKTLAYLLPLVQRVENALEEVQAIVVVPSRELARQTHSVLTSMNCGVRCEAVYGGRPAMEEHRLLRDRRPHVIVGTPGRLLDHLAKGNIMVQYVGNLVIDEFDKCLEMGFREELQSLVSQLSQVTHRILLSATDSPEIPRFITLGQNTEKLDYCDGDEQVSHRVTLYQVNSPIKDKLDSLGLLLSDLGQQSSIVFVGYRESVERVAQYLRKLQFAASEFHGGMEQNLRERALFRFASGACNILISTDLASRGLDLPEVDNIIHYHLPMDEATFIHRNGRTARWEASGTSYLLMGPGEILPDFLSTTPQTYLVKSPKVNVTAPRWESLYIGRGKKEKLSRGDIAGFMMKTGELAPDEVGRIEVRDHCAYVSVARHRVKELMGRIKGQKIKGMKTIIEPTR